MASLPNTRGYSRPASSETSPPSEEPPTPVCAALARAVFVVDERLQLARQHLGVAVAPCRLCGGGGRRVGVYSETRRTPGIVDAHQDDGLDRAAQNQFVGGDVGAPVLSAERGGGIEKVLPVLQIEDRVARGRRPRNRAEDRPRYRAAWRDSGRRNGGAGECGLRLSRGGRASSVYYRQRGRAVTGYQ